MKLGSDIMEYLSGLSPLLREFKPEGWIDFREGYNRGARFGLFVWCDDPPLRENPDSPPRSPDHFEFKALFDNLPDADMAQHFLNTVPFVQDVSIRDAMGLWSVHFKVPRDTKVPSVEVNCPTPASS